MGEDSEEQIPMLVEEMEKQLHVFELVPGALHDGIMVKVVDTGSLDIEQQWGMGSND